MVPYILVAVFPLLVESVYNEHSNRSAQSARRRRWIYVLLALIPMFVLIGFRNQSLGNDTNTYLQTFLRLIDTPWSELFENSRMEHGFLVFTKLLTYVTKSALAYQVICAAICAMAVFSFANQMERSPFLFIFLFCTMGLYTFMFSGLRQTLAMCICLFSFYFIKNRKIIPFLLFVLLAFFFHKSAVLFIAVYFVYPRKLSIFNTVLYVGIGAFCVAYIEALQLWFNELLEYDYEIESTGNGGIFLAFLFVLTALAAFLLISYKRVNKESVGYLNVAILSLIMWVTRLVTRVAERPSYYFLFFSCAAIAYAVDSLGKPKERYIVKLAVIGLCLVLYIYRFLTNYATLVPYKFFA